MFINDPTIKLIEKLSAIKKDMHEILQGIDIDSILYNKFIHLENKLLKLEIFNIKNIYLGGDLKNVKLSNSKYEVEHLEKDFLLKTDFSPKVESIFILTNNDIGSSLNNYLNFRNTNEKSIFIIWDWDSQHWTYMSCMLCLESDFYISGGSENTYFLSHFTPNVLGPVFGAVYQWSRQFLIENIDVLFKERINEPLGVHYFYENYPQRNRAIASVNKTYPTVRFGDNSYKDRSDLENLIEWASHKTHWIMPVMGGMPLRGYNAILTGGIPILPSYLKNFPEIAIMGDIPLFYEVPDLIEPKLIQEAAILKFDSMGKNGVIKRVLESLSTQHIDGRCDRILDLVLNAIVRIKRSDRSYIDGYFKI